MAVKSLFLLSVKVILNLNIAQIACTMLPPAVLQYLLYQAVCLENRCWIEGLVRYWPLKILSFDFENFFDDDAISNEIRCEIYLRRHHSWYHSSDYPQMVLKQCIVVAIATGLYQRVYQSQSQPVDHTMSGTKQYIIDLSMVKMEIIGKFLCDVEG